MQLIRYIKAMQEFSECQRKINSKIGFVPTMGFLHEGHLSLISRAKKETDLVIVSIFVNPTQFSPKEDFKSYPRNLKTDLELCEKAGADIVFAPNEKEIYENHLTWIEVKDLSEGLDGISRPTHFRGVATIVAKLFNIVKPHKAFFGLKDLQQVIVIEKMVKDLNFDLEIVRCETIREKDGLAMSSRNTYLNSEERSQATVLFEALQLAKKLIFKGEKNAEKIKKELQRKISLKPLAKIDFIEIVSLKDLKSVKKIENNFAVLLAVVFGKTRLIDNMVFEKVN